MKYILIITIAGCMFSCSPKADDLTPPELTPAGINTSEITLTVVNDNVEADGVKYAELLLKVGPTVLAKYREANFEISPIGKFNNGSTTQRMTIDVNGEVRVFTSSNLQGIANIKATIGDFAKQTIVHFLPAYPDQLFIEPDSSTLSPVLGTKTLIKARLVRVSGQVTAGHIVNFYDSTINNTSIGVFLNTSVANASGLATTEYWIQDTSYHGYVYIKGYVINGTNRVRGMNIIRIR